MEQTRAGVDVLVNFSISGNYCFSFVFGFGNVANEVETKEK